MSDYGTPFAVSSNGDRWYLVTDGGAGKPFVLHEANRASGGAESLLAVPEFLGRDPEAPQTKSLIEIMETLMISALAKPGEEALLKHMREATEDAVAVALEGTKIELPLTTSYEALEFFNCMLDSLTAQRAEDDAAEALRIPAGFGSTH